MTELKKDLNLLLAREVTRKEFLLLLVAIFVSLIGIKGMLRDLSGKASSERKKGFGKSVYGK